MTDRQEERLVELLEQTGMLDSKSRCRIAAEELLANGVIVPPCKVGDKVYYFSHRPFNLLLLPNTIYEADVVRIVTTKFGTSVVIQIHNDYGCTEVLQISDFGKTVFLTKEEAEQALVTDTNVGSKKELGK